MGWRWETDIRKIHKPSYDDRIEFINEYIRNGAEFLAIITNDGWWGDSQGHKQLLSLSRLRAIESRRSIVRSANTGISAIIDSRGNIIK